ncbi:hypothetical protein [Thermomonospora cellulosilytica]|uniref:Uncharacterized protein n=1 Tax=Thermomonospora cellulosilytica TaxID=1411118 RepID=A0A7W3N1L9_9ACTN|nr:hypothetical protein [Thermomonospora cellulosilytica]MBA9005905.1 hypothetical protein [Thermomonospora cellulosilytica]
MSAGAGVTIEGTGSPGNPYVISAEGAGLQVHDTPTVDMTLLGAGTDADPHILSAQARLSTAPGNLLTQGPDGLTVTCEDVQDCVGQTVADGLEYDDGSNQIRARVSTQAGNSLSIGPDGGLFAPEGGGATIITSDTPCIALDGDGAGTPLSATPIVDPAAGNLLQCGPAGMRAALTAGACGLTGDGTAAAPLAAKVAPWPYACDIAANAGGVYCDGTGQLRSEPRGKFTIVQADQQDVLPTPQPVPTGTAPTLQSQRTINVQNPDACRPALAIISVQLDVYFNFPGGGSAGSVWLDGDELQYLFNNGTSAVNGVHCQVVKFYRVTVPPGATVTHTFNVQLSRGNGGSQYREVTTWATAWIFAL